MHEPNTQEAPQMTNQIEITQADLEAAAAQLSCEEALNESNRTYREAYVLSARLLSTIAALYVQLSEQPARLTLGAGGYADIVAKIGDAKVYLAGLGMEVSTDPTPHDNQQLLRDCLMESVLPIMADANMILFLVSAAISSGGTIPALSLRAYMNSIEAGLNGLLFNLLTTPYAAAAEAKTRIMA